MAAKRAEVLAICEPKTLWVYLLWEELAWMLETSMFPTSMFH
jgi:hypothetical protein